MGSKESRSPVEELPSDEDVLEMDPVVRPRPRPVLCSRSLAPLKKDGLNKFWQVVNFKTLLCSHWSYRLINLTEDLLLRTTKMASLLGITVLNLHGNGLSKLTHLNSLSVLKRLIVSFNELTKLDSIAHLVSDGHLFTCTKHPKQGRLWFHAVLDRETFFVKFAVTLRGGGFHCCLWI